jgi:hypothetical protein
MNCDVATLLGFKNCFAGAKNGNLKAAATQQAAAFAAQLNKLPFKPSKRDLGMFPLRVFVRLCRRLSNPTADEFVEELSRREVLQQGKYAPRLLKARETALEFEAREDDDDDEFDDDDDEFEEDQ